jgi:hypothetical protein
VIAAVAERTAVEWFSDAPVVVPPAIAELGIPALAVDVPGFVRTGCRDDLVSLDGREVPIRVDADGTVATCDGLPVAVGAGEHRLDVAAGRDTGIDVDRLVLAAGVPAGGPVATSDPGAAPEVTVLDEGRDSVRVRVDGASPGEPFWLVLGQSHNAGWELDGQGGSDLVDGFANGWLVTPDAATFELTASWRPQRVVNVALAVSAAAALLCVVLAARRRPTSGSEPVLRVRDRTRSGSAPTRWAVPVVAGGLSLVWIGPVSALVVTAAAVAGVVSPLARRWLRAAPALALAGAAAYVLARQAIAQPGAAFEWPAELETAHEPALVAVALLALVASHRRPE